MTVLEVAIIDPDTEDCDELIDLAIERARELQLAHALLTQAAVRLLSRRHLPLLVHIIRGSSRGDGDPSYDEHHVHLAFDAHPAAAGLPEPKLTEEQVQWLPAVVADVAERAAFVDYGDLRREALVQHQFDGNERLAITTLATAGEVLVEELILHLTWEDGIDPYEAAVDSGSHRAHSARLHTDLSSMLGGNWTASGTHPVGRYLRDLVYLRHRVVHAGYRPPVSSVAAAIDALIGLEGFIGDRLCDQANLNRYTRTAMALLGNRGIERRGRWTSTVNRLVNDPDQPHWRSSFSRWRSHYQRGLDPHPPPPGTDRTKVVLTVGRGVDGSDIFGLYDEVSLHGLVVNGGEYTTPAALEMADLLLATRPPGETGHVALPLLPDKPLPETGWLPAYHLFPEATVASGAHQVR